MFRVRRPRKVFVSSTSQDLEQWRARVTEVLEQEGLAVFDQGRIPAMAAGAAPGSAAIVGACDVLIGIYALAMAFALALAFVALALLKVSARPSFDVTVLETVSAPPLGASALAFDPANGTLATGDDDGNGKVYLWHRSGGYFQKRPFARAHGLVKNLAFSKRGDRLIALGLGKADLPAHVICWSVPDGKVLWNLPMEARSLAIQNRGPQLAVGTADGAVYLIDERGRTRAQFRNRVLLTRSFTGWPCHPAHA